MLLWALGAARLLDYMGKLVCEQPSTIGFPGGIFARREINVSASRVGAGIQCGCGLGRRLIGVNTDVAEVRAEAGFHNLPGLLR
jgi:hypothetical protein